MQRLMEEFVNASFPNIELDFPFYFCGGFQPFLNLFLTVFQLTHKRKTNYLWLYCDQYPECFQVNFKTCCVGIDPICESRSSFPIHSTVELIFIALASHIIISFIPYLLRIYILKRLHPLKLSNCSSMVKNTLKEYNYFDNPV